LKLLFEHIRFFGYSLLREEKSAFFPEDELRQERNMTEDDDVGGFDTLDKLVMGQSFHELELGRKSTTSILSDHKDQSELATKFPSNIINEGSSSNL
jgi:hypothetical protein